MRHLILVIVAVCFSLGTVQAIDGIKVDGLHGTETSQAIKDNPELAKKFNLTADGQKCDNNNKNCGGSLKNVRLFQEAVNAEKGKTKEGEKKEEDKEEDKGEDIYKVRLFEPITSSGPYEDIKAENGVDLINKYMAMVYRWMASIIGLVAVLMIVVSGIQIIFGGASPEMVSDAKTRLIQSLLSLILLFATALIIKTVNPGFFGYQGVPESSSVQAPKEAPIPKARPSGTPRVAPALPTDGTTGPF